MEALTKSAIMQKVVWAVDHSEALELEALLKKTGKQVTIKIGFKDQEVYIDENGVKWVRA